MYQLLCLKQLITHLNTMRSRALAISLFFVETRLVKHMFAYETRLKISHFKESQYNEGTNTPGKTDCYRITSIDITHNTYVYVLTWLYQLLRRLHWGTHLLSYWQSWGPKDYPMLFWNAAAFIKKTVTNVSCLFCYRPMAPRHGTWPPLIAVAWMPLTLVACAHSGSTMNDKSQYGNKSDRARLK